MATKAKKIEAYDPVVVALIEPRESKELKGYEAVESLKSVKRIEKLNCLLAVK